MAPRSARGATTLPAHYYLSAELFARERERIFRDDWLYAGHISELEEAGAYRLFELDGDSVILTRGDDGPVRAFHNVCRHRGTRLCAEPSGSFAGAIQCPYHAWTYELDGRLRAAPNMHEVEGFDAADYPLRPVAVGSLDGLLFVNLSPAPAPFEEHFAPLRGKFARWRMDELLSVHQTAYEVDANWKLFFQNYSECYHCPTVHPVLNRLTPYRDTSNDLEDGPFLGGPMRMSIEGGSMTMTGERCAPLLPGIEGEDRCLVYYYTVFPNLFVSLHPDYVLIHRSESLAPGSTRILCDWFFHPDALAGAEFDPSEAIEFWDMTNRQDWKLCALSQRGIASSAYAPGPYSELESQLAAFDRHYLAVLGDD